MLFGQLSDSGHVGKLRNMWNCVVLSDIHHLCNIRPYQVTQTGLPGELRLAPYAPSPGWHTSVFSLAGMPQASQCHAG